MRVLKNTWFVPAIFILLGISFSFSCQRQPRENEAVQHTIARMEHSDEALLQIAEDAQRTVHLFFRNLLRTDLGGENFSIKYPFMADSDSGIVSEQVWLSGIQFDNGLYYGVIVSEPQHLTGMRRGDTVMFDVDEITDWMYTQNGRIIGGRSIQYLLEQIPEAQRSEEQRRILLRFD